MEQAIKVGNLLIKARIARDKKGRNGYFITDSAIKKSKGIEVVSYSKKPLKPTKEKVRLEVEQSLKELRDYKDGKLKLRSIDEYLKTI
jgi:co-chaperonin GroES (HSP10)